MIIKTKKFILRPFRKGDEKSLIENINDKNISKYMSIIPYPYPKKDADKWIKNCINQKKTKHRKEFVFAIDKNGVIGGIGFSNIDGHKVEFGYWLGRNYWGQGIIFSAAKLVLKFGFRDLKLKRVYAYIYKHNKRSIKILKKLKFKKDGLLIKHIKKNGKFFDCYLYAKTK